MGNLKDGGSAFPSEGGKRFIHGNEVRTTLPSSGLSVRDYFAAKAMQGLLSGGGDFEKFADVATDSYAIADAMIKAREE